MADLVTVALVMMARDEEAIIGRACRSARGLVDSWVLLDTGSTDRTIEEAQEALDGVPGRVIPHAWAGFAEGRTAALAAARDTADWLLMVDADQTVEAHPDFRAWLDPDPDVDVYAVTVAEAGTSWLMPRLTRARKELRYVGATHEWLDGDVPCRALHAESLTLRHHGDGAYRPVKHERDLELLAAGTDPRSVYYRAQTLWCLGRTEEAADTYAERGRMDGTWEEERWHAQYMAARLRDDVPGLLAAHARRPWRHEPLTWAARIVAREGHTDVLFCEDGGHG